MKSFIKSSDLKKDVPKKVQEHLKKLIKETKLPDSKDSMNKLMEAWLTKRALFHKMVEHEKFQKAVTMDKDNKNGCIAITISGSIIAMGPLVANKREIQYTSIGMRLDVPKSLSSEKGCLAKDVQCDKPILFEEGPIKKTSPIMDLAISSRTDSEKQQLAIINNVNKKLKADFVRVNKEALAEEDKEDVLKKRNDLFQKWIIIAWFILGGIEKHIFIARAKILWLELFTKVYTGLSKKIKNKEKRDTAFLDFTNHKFTKFIDEYKWYESEKKNYDIGLMKALEDLPQYRIYIDLRDSI